MAVSMTDTTGQHMFTYSSLFKLFVDVIGYEEFSERCCRQRRDVALWCITAHGRVVKVVDKAAKLLLLLGVVDDENIAHADIAVKYPASAHRIAVS